MDFLMQQLTAMNNEGNFGNEEEEEWDDYEFLETLHGLSKKLPSFFGLSDQLMDQMLEFYFYDVTKIGKLFATEEGKNNVLKKFGIPLECCSEKLYLQHALNEDSEYTCPLCEKKVKGNDIFALICSHFFCRECWVSSVKNGDLKCLKRNCNCRMPFIDAHDLYPEINSEKFKSMVEVLTRLEYEMKLIVKKPENISCPNCSQRYDLVYARFGCILCRKCKKTFCIRCRKEAHLPLSCEEYQEFSAIRNKYSSHLIELGQYKQYRSCKIRFEQQKKEIQQIIQFMIKSSNEIQQKLDEILNQNILNIRKIYELIENLNDHDFYSFNLLNDQEFLSNKDTIEFKEKYPKQFSHFYNVYQSIIKKEAEAKVFFSNFSDAIEQFESDTVLSSYLYDLSIISCYAPPPSEIRYEVEPSDLELEMDSDIGGDRIFDGTDEDSDSEPRKKREFPSVKSDNDFFNLNKNDKSNGNLNLNSNDNNCNDNNSNYNDNNNNDNDDNNNNNDDNNNNNDDNNNNNDDNNNNNDDNNNDNDNNSNYNDNDNNNNDNDNNNNDNDNNNNNNDDNNNNDGSYSSDGNVKSAKSPTQVISEEEIKKKDEEVRKFVEDMSKKHEMEMKEQMYRDNPYKEALDVYMSLFKGDFSQMMAGEEYDIEKDEEAVEYSVNRNLIRIFNANSKVFLHFNRKSKNINFLIALIQNIDKLMFRGGENLKYDLSYYLILLRYFSNHRQ